MPPGLLNVLPGTGASAGAALVAHAGVKMVSFTGGTASGRASPKPPAKKLMPVSLELGGKSPHIVFADADLDAAVPAVAGGIFEAAASRAWPVRGCSSQRGVLRQVLAALSEIARTLRVDRPDAAGAQMGPLASFVHRDAWRRWWTRHATKAPTSSAAARARRGRICATARTTCRR